ncbi:hypothetical protein NDU88_003373 [Pleurodeles waltl]|uniref:Uncharacterized protein n=1 Tax=Pleurodeles waltl TaxID=8319 RepID=A0AAV7VHN8_PLEWA|nr:hypothetical protein NDU88_003373 [Pleurodeles waltl]
MQSGRVKWRPCRNAILKSECERKAERPRYGEKRSECEERDRSLCRPWNNGPSERCGGGQGKRLQGGLGPNGNPRGDWQRCWRTRGPRFRSLHQREEKRIRLAGPG